MANQRRLEEVILRLYDVEGLKFGSFTMRTGEVTPVYIDMRVIWSYPDIVVRGETKSYRFYYDSVHQIEGVTHN